MDTDAGISIEIRFPHSQKEASPIFFKLSESFTSFKLVQCPYLQPIITQYFIDNKSEIWLLFLIAHSKR